MKRSRARYFQQNMDRLTRRDRVFINNPVVMQGLGIAPIVISATNIQNATILAMGVLLLLTPTRMLATFIGQHTGFKFRAVIYALTSGLVFVGVAWALEAMFGSALTGVGIYLPLLVFEPLVLKRYGSPKRERVITSLKKGLLTTMGFCLVLFLSAGLRELLAAGTLGGVEVFRGGLLPIAALPAGGFIMLGLIIAVWRGFVNTFKRSVESEVTEAP